ncbi:MAG: DUF952 domain-containing protein [Deltaproteobacteria bacterium]
MSHPTAGDAALYKICPRQSWSEALSSGRLPLSRDDARDGYVHLSSAQQLPGTLERHFAAEPDLVLLVIPRSRLPEGALRWEPSRRGEPFPHLYAELRAELVAEVLELPLDGERRHVLPRGL